MAYPWKCAIAITPSGVRLLLLWCPPLVSPYPFLLPRYPLDPPTATTDDVHHLHHRDPTLQGRTARLQGRTARRQVRRPSPSGRRRGSGGFVLAEVCGDNAQVLGAVRPALQHLLLLRQVRHRRRDQEEKTSFVHGLADHKDQLGAPLCPCRHYDDKAADAAQGFWNCPCRDNEEVGEPVANYFGITGQETTVLAYTGNEDSKKFFYSGEISLDNIKLQS
ncbi:uncharacterized protein LOC123450444 [Hordeum vulgare subsp. vulgare]|uniref:uncharacterized protein LOC123450444 n=1 Tax=Hordeum vulgare subsp. vulgare TaxID=112509 RepID=UPI001D1A35E2|nr:uncharacterized protein LOC123450444 [Hordeum vulgare subsp. vulgare]